MPVASGTARTQLTPYGVMGQRYAGFGGKASGATGFGRLEYTMPRHQLEYTLEPERPEFTMGNERLEFTGAKP